MQDLFSALRQLRLRPALLIPGALAAFALGSGSLVNLVRILLLWRTRRQLLAPVNTPFSPELISGAGQVAGQVAATAPSDERSLRFFLIALVIGITLLLLALLLVGAAIGLGAIALIAQAGEKSARSQPFILGTAINLSLKRAGRLLLLASLPGIPLLLTLIVGVIAASFYLGANVPRGDLGALRAALIAGRDLWGLLLLLNLPGLLVLLFMTLMQGLAMRAALFEDLPPLDSFRRAWALIRRNPLDYLALQGGQIMLQLLIVALLVTFSFIPLLRWLTSPLALALNAGARAIYALSWSSAWVRWTDAEAAPV